MSYTELITEATGITDPTEVAKLEEIMRCDIFHSTLDWQTREQLMEAAKTAQALTKMFR